MSSPIITTKSETGGAVYETAFIRVVFQNGPSQERINGCRVEDVIDMALKRLHHYQAGELACDENAQAIQHLLLAKDAMFRRLQRREMQGVLHTMLPHQSERTEDEQEDFSATGA